MKKVLFAALLAFCPAIASAAPVASARAIEFPEYSRIVLPLNSAVDWTVVRDGKRAILMLRGPTPEIDLSSLRGRIARTRVLSVEKQDRAEGTDIVLTLGCACSVEVSRIGSAIVAVDVRRDERKPSENGGRIADLNAPGVNSPEVSTLQKETSATVQPVPKAITHTQPDKRAKQSDLPEEGAVEPLHGPLADPEIHARMVVARNALVDQITRAAEGGVLSLAPEASDQIDRMTAPPTVEPPSTNLSTSTNPMPVSRDLPARPVSAAVPLSASPNEEQIRVRTPFEEDVPEPQTPARDGQNCPPDGTLSMARWDSGDGEPAQRIGLLRRALVDSAGNVDGAALTDLARYYIAVGFGREAELLISKADEGMAGRDILEEIARLIDGKASADGALQVAEACDASVEVWRMAAGFAEFPEDPLAADEMLLALGEVPPRLRRLLGEKLAYRALLDGAPDRARRVFEMLDRTPGHLAEGEALLRTTASVLSGGTKSVEIDRHRFNSLLAHATPDMIGHVADAVLAVPASSPPGFIDTLRDTARDMKGTPAANELMIQVARLEAHDGEHGKALSILSSLRTEDPAIQTRISQAGRDILSGIDTTDITGPDLVRSLMLGRNFLDGGTDSARLRKKMARDLIQAGLPNSAEALVERAAIVVDLDTRLLTAETALSSGQHSKALDKLLNVNAPEAVRLRAEVLRRAGAMDRAFETVKELAVEDPERNRLAFLSRNLAEVEIAELDEDLQPMARVLMELEQPESGGRDDLRNLVGPQTPTPENTAAEKLDMTSALLGAFDAIDMAAPNPADSR